MIWDKEKDHKYFEELWSSRTSSALSHKKEDWDGRAAGWEKSLKEDEDAKERSRARVQATADYLRSKGLLGENSEVVDIGCGPGRFVAEFAKTAGHVTGVDISPNMCGFGEEYAKRLGLSNTSFVSCDFKSKTVAELGWEKKFDLVFSSITPAMSTYESMQKSLEMSRGYCFQSNYASASDPLTHDILGKLFPETVKKMERSIRSTYVLVNLLWLEGFYPEVTYYKDVSHVIRRADESLMSDILKFVPPEQKTDEIQKKVLAMLKDRADADGTITVHREWLYSWTLWNVNK